MTLPRLESTLHAGLFETRYVRAGTGEPLVLLFAAGIADPLAAALFAGLAAHFRVYAPELPAGIAGAGATPAMPASRWLREVLDGLGLERAALVADEPLVGAALALVLVAPARVRGAIAIDRDHGEPVEAIDDQLARSGHGLAVVLVDAAAPASAGPAAVEEIVARLAPGRAPR